jgi:hypothetical protein
MLGTTVSDPHSGASCSHHPNPEISQAILSGGKKRTLICSACGLLYPLVDRKEYSLHFWKSAGEWDRPVFTDEPLFRIPPFTPLEVREPAFRHVLPSFFRAADEFGQPTCGCDQNSSYRRLREYNACGFGKSNGCWTDIASSGKCIPPRALMSPSALVLTSPERFQFLDTSAILREEVQYIADFAGVPIADIPARAIPTKINGEWKYVFRHLPVWFEGFSDRAIRRTAKHISVPGVTLKYEIKVNGRWTSRVDEEPNDAGWRYIAQALAKDGALAATLSDGAEKTFAPGEWRVIETIARAVDVSAKHRRDKPASKWVPEFLGRSDELVPERRAITLKRQSPAEFVRKPYKAEVSGLALFLAASASTARINLVYSPVATWKAPPAPWAGLEGATPAYERTPATAIKVKRGATILRHKIFGEVEAIGSANPRHKEKLALSKADTPNALRFRVLSDEKILTVTMQYFDETPERLDEVLGLFSGQFIERPCTPGEWTAKKSHRIKKVEIIGGQAGDPTVVLNVSSLKSDLYGERT